MNRLLHIIKALPSLVMQTVREFGEDDIGLLGAALAYYAVFSVFPLMLLLLAAVGFVLGSREAVQQQIMDAISRNFAPSLAQAIQQALTQVEQNAGAATWIGLITLLLGASGVFQQLDVSFNRIWKTPKPPQQPTIWQTILTAVHDKLFSFLMVLGVGVLLIISTVLTGVTNALLGVLSGVPVLGGAFGFVVGLAITLALNTLIFAVLFKYLPNTRVEWADVLLGALLAAILWEIAKRLLAFYIEHSAFASAYGVIGTVLVLMVWVFFSSQLLFAAAEFTHVYARWRRTHRVAPPAPEPAAPPTSPPQFRPEPVATVPAGASRDVRNLAKGVVGGALATLVLLAIGAVYGAGRLARRTGEDERRTHGWSDRGADHRAAL
jgi:membrane protein